jgi:hypothetical protein
VSYFVRAASDGAMNVMAQRAGGLQAVPQTPLDSTVFNVCNFILEKQAEGMPGLRFCTLA